MGDAALDIGHTELATRSLRRGLRRLRWRARLLISVQLATGGIAIAAATAALAVVLLRLSGAWYSPLLPAACLGAVVIAAGAAGLAWPLSDQRVAVSADRRLGLRDRLGTAVSLARAPEPQGMGLAALADAVHHLDRVRPAQAYPIRVHRGTKAAGLCLAALALAQTLPIPALFVSPREREERAVLRQEAAKIEPLAREMKRAAEEANDREAERAARRLQELAQKLHRGQLDKKQALLSLDEIAEEVQKLDQRLAAAHAKTAEEAAGELQAAAQEDLASKATELAREAEKAGDVPAAEQMRRLAEQARRSRDASELMRLADTLEQRAREMGAPPAIPTDLTASLSAALSNADISLSEEALKKLAEAATDWKGSLSPEDMERLARDLEQLAKALEGTDLSELAKALREAAKCLRAGDCGKAAQLLRDAIANCKDGLTALRLAGACSKCSGGLSRSLSAVRGSWLALGPRRGQSSAPGLGVGPDNGSQQSIPPNAPAASLYAPRETETSGDLVRVGSQVRPQGQMFATTEKGAPTKLSESRVPYYEVIGNYSRAAEEALAREEVPPSYRATVRSYFDALQSGARPTRADQATEGGSR